MFKELISYYLKYHKDKCFFSAQMFETLKNNIEKDLIESYELSSNLVQDHMSLFNSSGSYFDFLLNLFKIKNFKFEKIHYTHNLNGSEAKRDFEEKFKIENIKKECDTTIHKQTKEIQRLQNELKEQISKIRQEHAMEIENLTEKFKRQETNLLQEQEKYKIEIKKLINELNICQQEKNTIEISNEKLQKENLNFLQEKEELKNLTERLNCGSHSMCDQSIAQLRTEVFKLNLIKVEHDKLKDNYNNLLVKFGQLKEKNDILKGKLEQIDWKAKEPSNRLENVERDLNVIKLEENAERDLNFIKLEQMDWKEPLNRLENAERDLNFIKLEENAERDLKLIKLQENAERDLNLIKYQLENAERDLNSIKLQYDNLKETYKNLLVKCGNLEEKNISLEEKLANYSSLKYRLEKSEQDVELIKFEYNNMKETYTNLLVDNRKLEEQNNVLIEKLEICTESKKQLEMNWTDIKEYKPSAEEIEYSNLKYRLENAEQDLEEMKKENAKLNELNLNFQSELVNCQKYITNITANHQKEMEELRMSFEKDHKYLVQKVVQLAKEDQELQYLEEQNPNYEEWPMEFDTNEDLNLQLTNCLDINKKLKNHLLDCVQQKKELISKFKEIYYKLKTNITEAQGVIQLLNNELESKTIYFKNLQERYNYDMAIMHENYKKLLVSNQTEQESDETTEPLGNNNFREQLIHIRSRYKLLKREKARLNKYYKNILKEKDIELNLCIKNLETRQSKEALQLYEENIALQQKIYSLSLSNQQNDVDYERFKADQEERLKMLESKLVDKEKQIENLKRKFQDYMTVQKKNLSDMNSKLKAQTVETYKLEKQLSDKKLLNKKNLTERVKQQDPKINTAKKIQTKYMRQSRKQFRQKNKLDTLSLQRNILEEETPYIETEYTQKDYEHDQIVDLCKNLYLKYFNLYQRCIKTKTDVNPKLEELNTLLQTLKEKNKGELIQILFDYVIQEVNTEMGNELKNSDHLDEILEHILIQCAEMTETYIKENKKGFK